VTVHPIALTTRDADLIRVPAVLAASSKPVAQLFFKRNAIFAKVHTLGDTPS
jgi:hypothetical protein